MHKRIYHYRVILLLMSFVIIASCNILEDRDECPCRLLLQAVDLPEGQYEPVVYIYEGGVMKERIEVPAGLLKEGYVHEIARDRDVVIYVWCDSTGRLDFPVFDLNGTTVSGEYGEALPALFRDEVSIDTHAESMTVEIDFNKRFANLDIQILETEKIHGVSISGNNNGYTIGGEPLMDEFFHEPDIARQNGYVRLSSRIPRQTDDGLVINIKYEDGAESRILLGKILENKGYNWDADDLIDISIRIEGGTTGITLKSAEWNTGYDKDLTI